MKLVAMIAVLLPIAAHAAPPPGADPVLHAWFESQHSVEGQWCCDVSDGHILADADWRMLDQGYQVRIHGEWIDVPASSLRDTNGGPNPTGAAIAWWLPSEKGPVIFCFAPGVLY